MSTPILPHLSLRLKVICCMTVAFVFGPQNSQAQSSHPADERGYIVRVGEPVPNFELHSIDGQLFTRENLLGQAYVLQFTASWCGVCRQEMPHLEQDVWQPNKGADFTLIGVDFDEPKEKVEAFAQQMGITYPIAPDPEGELFYQIAGPKSGVTRNVVVDANGNIAFLTRLFEAQEFEAMKAAIARVIP